jgi:hypothetical protein
MAESDLQQRNSVFTSWVDDGNARLEVFSVCRQTRQESRYVAD